MPPIPPAAAGALAQGGAALVGDAAGAFFTGLQNRASRKWSEKMYRRTYEDNLAFWHMQNNYNSPQAQMQRFQEAGLNPNLIYGRGESGNAGAIPTPDVIQPEFRVPNFDRAAAGLGGFLETMYNLEIKQATVDNLKRQGDVLTEDALLKNVERRFREFNLGLETELRDTSLDFRREELRQRYAQTNETLSRNELNIVQATATMRESAERILNMRAERARTRVDASRIRATIDLIKKDTRIKELDIELRRMGINPHHPLWAQVVGRLINFYSGGDLSGIGNFNQGPENPAIRRMQSGRQ